MRKYLFRGNKGFTLLEVVVAMGILAIGLTGTMMLLMGIIRADKLNNEMSRATALAQDRIEEIRQDGYFGWYNVTSPVSDTPVAGFTRITTVSGSGTSGVLDIDVTVNYLAFGQHRVTQQTLLSREIR